MKIDILTLFNNVLKIVIPVFVGMVASKLGFFKGDFSKKLSDLVLKICQPFLILTSILSIEYSAENLVSGLKIMLLSVIIHVIMCVGAFFAACGMKDEKARRATEFCMIFANMGFFGIPLIKSVYGSLGVFWAGFFYIPFNIIMWGYGPYLFSKANPEVKINPLKMFFNAGTVPCYVGFVLYILRVPIYQPLMESMQSIGNVCTPVSMFVIGAMLINIPIKRLLFSAETWYTLLLRMIFFPFICGIALHFLGFQREMVFFGAIMAALPTAAAAAMFGETYDVRPDLGAQAVGITSLASLLTVPGVIGLLSLII